MDRLKKLLNEPSVKVVLVYVVFSAFWIVFTDRIVEQIFTDPSTITQAQTVKGWLFVLVSGGVLIWVIHIMGRQLEMSQDQYKAMLGDANIGIARLERMKVVSSNPAFRSILGRDSKELAEYTVFEFIDEYDRDEFRKAVERLKKQNSVQLELKVKLIRNKRRWVQINISKHKDKEGEYHQVILQDINDRKTYHAYTDLLLQVMLTLEPTENFKAGLRGILNNLCMELNWEYGVAFTPGTSGDYQKQVSWYRLDPLFDEFDSKVESYRFKNGEGLIGLTAREKKSVWIENLETDQWFMYRDDAIDADLRSVVSVPVVVSDDVIAVLILFSRERLDSDEELLKLLTAIGHDIGIKLEKRKQQDEKEKLEQSLNFALKSATMASWDMDLETGNVVRSHNHHELFGLDKAPETWNVDDLIDIILEEDRENVIKKLYESFFETKGFNAEFRIRINGRIRWLWSRGDLQYDKYGEPERLSGVITDVTKRKQFQIYTELLLDIFLSIEPLKDLQKAYENILKVICKKNIWQYGEIWQYDKESGTSECTNTWSHQDDELLKSFGSYSRGIIYEQGEGIPGIGNYSNELHWIPDVRQEKRFLRRKKVAGAGLKSAVSIPLSVDGEPVATIQLFTKYQLDEDEDTINFLNAIRNNLGMKLARKKAVERLEKTEKSLKYALNASRMAAWDVDLDTGGLTLSENYEDVIGLDLGDNPVFDRSLPHVLDEDRQKFAWHIEKAIDGKGEIDIEYRIRNKHDEVRWHWSHGHYSQSNSGRPRISGIVRDVTEKKTIELELNREQELLEKLYDTVPVMFTIYRPDLSEFRVNKEFERITGWRNEELDKIDLVKEVYPDEEHRKEVVEFMNQPGKGWKETDMKIRDGSTIHSTWTNIRLMDDTQIGIGLDITEQKKLREQIESERQELLTIFNNMPVFINIHDEDTGIGEVNRFFEDRLGYTQSAVRDKNLLKLITTEEGYEEARKHIRKADGKWKDFELITKDGERLQSTWTNIRLSEARSIGIGLDITERKKMEEELKENEERLQLTTTSAKVGLWEWHPQTGETVFDEIWANLVGYTLQELEPVSIKTWNNLVQPDDLKKFEEEVDRYFNGEVSSYECEVRMKHKEGHWVWILDRGSIVEWDDAGKPQRMVGTHIDITERKKQEQLLAEKQNQLIKAQEIARMGYWKLELDEWKLSWSDMTYTIFGLDKDEFDLSVENFISMVHPDDRHILEGSDKRLVKAGALEHTYRFIKPDGNIVYVQERGEVEYRDDSNKIVLTGTVIDITDLKKIEEKAEAERQRFELAVDAVSDVVWDYDASQGTLWWNEGIETVFGYDRQAILGEKDFWENHIYAKDREKTIKSMREAENSDALKWSASYRFLDANGGIREVEDTARIIRDEEGNLVHIIGAMLDVTELKSYQRELQEERIRFEAIATLTNDVIYDYDVASEHFWASEGIYSIMGYDPDKYPVAIEWWKKHLHPEDRDRMIESLDNALESDANEWKESYRFIGSGVVEKHIIENALIIRDERNQPVRMLGAMIDATAEKEAQRALRESEEQYRRLFYQNPYPMWIYDPETFEILQVNQAMILKYGYTEKEFESITILDLSPPEEVARLKKELQQKPDGLRDHQGVTHLKKDGSKLIVDVTALDIRYKGDQQRLVVINDITRQKRAEEKIIGSVIEGSENERRRIAKDLHDGLGQYLTAASMNLDSVYEELNSLPEVKWNQYEKGLKLLRNAIVESRRISQNLLPKAIEDFGLSLAVQSLVDDFSDSFDAEISYSDNLGDIKLSESVELNIYRIIQEATNNAARHSGCSRIDIQLILDDHQLTCTIEDNGRGFDYSLKRDQGLGLTSIKNRVNALSGEMEISTSKGKGTLVSVIIPVKAV